MVQPLRFLAICSVALMKFVLNRSGDGAHVRPICDAALMKFLQPICVPHQVLNIFVLFAHRSLRCSCVSSLASQSICHAIHMFDSMSRSSMPQLSSGSARRRLSKMRCHASSISAADLSRRGCIFSVLSGEELHHTQMYFVSLSRLAYTGSYCVT